MLIILTIIVGCIFLFYLSLATIYYYCWFLNKRNIHLFNILNLYVYNFDLECYDSLAKENIDSFNTLTYQYKVISSGLKIIDKNIEAVNIMYSKMNIIKTIKVLKLIRADLAYLQSLKKINDQITTNYDDYSKNDENEVIQMIECFDKLHTFYINYLSANFTNQEFSNLIENIVQELNELFLIKDSKNFSSTFKQCFEKISNLNEQCYNTYIYSQYYNYIIDYHDNLLKDNKFTSDFSADIKTYRNYQLELEHTLNSIKKILDNIDFTPGNVNKINELIVTCFKLIHSINSIGKFNNIIHNFITSNIDKIESIIASIYEQIDSIVPTIKKMSSQYKLFINAEKNMQDNIENDINKMQSILAKFKDDELRQALNNQYYFKLINDLVNNINNVKTNIHYHLQEFLNNIEVYMSLGNQISHHLIVCGQLQYYAKKSFNSAAVVENYNNINNNLQQLNTEFNDLEDCTNFRHINDELDNLKNELLIFIANVNNDLALVEYARVLTMWVNRYRSNNEYKNFFSQLDEYKKSNDNYQIVESTIDFVNANKLIVNA